MILVKVMLNKDGLGKVIQISMENFPKLILRFRVAERKKMGKWEAIDDNFF